MKKIPLPNGDCALVDDDDFLILSKNKWHLNHNGYAWRWTSRSGGQHRRHVFMHRLIMHAPDGARIDHINRIRSDNRKENLRPCTNSQNLCNRPAQSNNKLGIKGVDLHRLGYRATIQARGDRRFLGYFDTANEAALAYAAAARVLHGEFARVTA